MSQLHTKWVSRRERDLWCIDFSGYDHDAAGLGREIDAAEDVLHNYPANSLLVAINLHGTRISAPIVDFFNRNTRNPAIHKFAIVGISGSRRFWYEKVKHVTWPKPHRFFDDYEQAKDWLVGESF
jgi:hypothetical protein